MKPADKIEHEFIYNSTLIIARWVLMLLQDSPIVIRVHIFNLLLAVRSLFAALHSVLPPLSP